MAFNFIPEFGNFWNLFSGKDRYTKTSIFNNMFFNGKDPQWVSLDGKEIEAFNTTPELNIVIMTKASMYANGVFRHYDNSGKESKELFNTDLLKLLNNPNPLQSRNEFLMEELIHSSVFGNSFLYDLRGSSSQEIPSVLYVLPASNMKVVPTGKIYQQSTIEGIISKFELLNYDGTTTDFETKDIIFSRVQNSENPLIGKSPLHALQMPISNIKGAYGLRNILINEKGAIGILSNNSSDGDGGIPLDNEERKRLESQYLRDYGTESGQSKIMMTSSSLRWQSMTFPTKDMMLFEEITADFKRIIDAFGMNEYLFALEKGGTYANLQEGKKMVYQDTIIPYANDFCFKLGQKFKLDERKESITLDYSHVEALQQNNLEQSVILDNKTKAVATLRSNGYSIDEVNQIVKF